MNSDELYLLAYQAPGYPTPQILWGEEQFVFVTRAEAEEAAEKLLVEEINAMADYGEDSEPGIFAILPYKLAKN